MPSIDTDMQCIRIPLSPPADLNDRIKTECDNFVADAYRLAGTFSIATELVLIF